VRILRIRASEETAALMFGLFSMTLFVADIDPWVDCVWLA
jgi:hypothetical protein